MSVGPLKSGDHVEKPVAKERDQTKASDPLNARCVMRPMTQNPSGASVWKLWIRVKQGTILLECGTTVGNGINGHMTRDS